MDGTRHRGGLAGLGVVDDEEMLHAAQRPGICTSTGNKLMDPRGTIITMGAVIVAMQPGSFAEPKAMAARPWTV